jgi:hypothetical protein
MDFAKGGVMADFTPTQGRYLAYIHAYTNLHGYPPAESEIAMAMCVSPPSVNLMVRMLEKKGLISRQPGRPRSVKVIIPEEEIPPWNKQKNSPAEKTNNSSKRKPASPKVAPTNLYVLWVFLTGGPISEKFSNKRIDRTIEIRGDQTLEELHQIIFQAFDRWDDHLYEFQFGKRPFDPNGPNYGTDEDRQENYGDARTTTLDDLDLKVNRVFGYWFDFGDDWLHQIQVVRIEQAISTVTYPRVIKRTGKSPPQYTGD